MLTAGEQVRLAPVSLLAGVACGVGTVAVYQWTWGLVLGGAVTLLTAVATLPGWGSRLPFGVGNAVVLSALSVPRGEGDYLISSSTAGYVVLAVGLVVLGFAVATVPRPGRRPQPPGPVDPLDVNTPDPASGGAGRE